MYGGTGNMKVYKAGDKYIAIHTRGNTVYSAQGSSEEEAESKVYEMIKKQESMKQEEQSLLLKDLCARLPYGLIALKNKDSYRIRGIKDDFVIIKERAVYGEKEWITKIETIKPYLRPMSSMTEEEEFEYHNVCISPINHQWDVTNWLNAHHFDYRGLIEKGLAIAVTEENNPYKE